MPLGGSHRACSPDLDNNPTFHPHFGRRQYESRKARHWCGTLYQQEGPCSQPAYSRHPLSRNARHGQAGRSGRRQRANVSVVKRKSSSSGSESRDREFFPRSMKITKDAPRQSKLNQVSDEFLQQVRTPAKPDKEATASFCTTSPCKTSTRHAATRLVKVTSVASGLQGSCVKMDARGGGGE